MANTYIGIASSQGETFENAQEDDLILYTSEPAKLLLGTQSNVQSKIQISASNVIMTDDVYFDKSIFVNDNMDVLGSAVIYNDLVVRGNLLTQRDITLVGNQIAQGASYCNGDLFVINDSATQASSNATIFLQSYYGMPLVSMQQTKTLSTIPFKLYQASNGEGYIENSQNIYFKNTNNIYATFSNNGYISIGGTIPKTKLDIYDGNINAGNIMRLKKYIGSSNSIDVKINWTGTVSGTENCIVLETTQQLNSTTKHGTRIQKHNIILGSNYNAISQVSYAFGDIDAYTALLVTASNSGGNSSIVRSIVSSFSGTNILHEMDVNILIAPQTMGHVWLS
jgi:hypothetical protein